MASTSSGPLVRGSRARRTRGCGSFERSRARRPSARPKRDTESDARSPSSAFPRIPSVPKKLSVTYRISFTANANFVLV